MTAVETVSCSKIVVAINYRSPYSIGGVSTCLKSNIVIVRARWNHRPWGTREVVVVKLGYHHRFKGIQSRGYELNFVRKGLKSQGLGIPLSIQPRERPTSTCPRKEDSR